MAYPLINGDVINGAGEAGLTSVRGISVGRGGRSAAQFEYHCAGAHALQIGPVRVKYGRDLALTPPGLRIGWSPRHELEPPASASETVNYDVGGAYVAVVGTPGVTFGSVEYTAASSISVRVGTPGVQHSHGAASAGSMAVGSPGLVLTHACAGSRAVVVGTPLGVRARYMPQSLRVGSAGVAAIEVGWITYEAHGSHALNVGGAQMGESFQVLQNKPMRVGHPGLMREAVPC